MPLALLAACPRRMLTVRASTLRRRHDAAPAGPVPRPPSSVGALVSRSAPVRLLPVAPMSLVSRFLNEAKDGAHIIRQN